MGNQWEIPWFFVIIPLWKNTKTRTACSIIPDSGTTLIAGNEAHIGALFEAVETVVFGGRNGHSSRG